MFAYHLKMGTVLQMLLTDRNVKSLILMFWNGEHLHGLGEVSRLLPAFLCLSKL
jgi:hypothetical protein